MLKIMNDLPDNVLGVLAEGKITGTDYETVLIPAIEKKLKELTVEEFLKWQESGEDIQVIDVREPAEYEQANIGALLIPLATVASRADEIRRDKKVVVHCKLGGRSAKAINELEEKFGFTNLYNLKGGITAYLQEVGEKTNA